MAAVFNTEDVAASALGPSTAPYIPLPASTLHRMPRACFLTLPCHVPRAFITMVGPCHPYPPLGLAWASRPLLTPTLVFPGGRGWAVWTAATFGDLPIRRPTPLANGSRSTAGIYQWDPAPSNHACVDAGGQTLRLFRPSA